MMSYYATLMILHIILIANRHKCIIFYEEISFSVKCCNLNAFFVCNVDAISTTHSIKDYYLSNDKFNLLIKKSQTPAL